MFLKGILSAVDSAAGQIDSVGSGREILLYNRPDTLRGIFAHKETKGGSGRLSRLHGLAKSRGTVVMGNHLLLVSTTMSIVIFIQLRSMNVTVEEMGQRLTLQYYSPWLCSEMALTSQGLLGPLAAKTVSIPFQNGPCPTLEGMSRRFLLLLPLPGPTQQLLGRFWR